MANGNSLENTAVVENVTNEEILDNVEQQDEGDIKLLESLGFNSKEEFLFNKEIPKQANIYIDDKLIQGGYKAIQSQIDAGTYGEKIKTVDDYVKAWGNKARVEPGRDAYGELITEEKAAMVDKPRVEDPVSEWSKKYGKNFTVDQMEVEFQTYTSAINLNESQQSDIDSFINEDDPNYDPDLLKPRAPERFTMEMATAVTPIIQPYQNEFNQAKKYLNQKIYF